MVAGLEKTFALLTETENEAAVDVLLRALDSNETAVQHAALRAILARRSVAGQLTVVRRWHTLPPDWLTILDEFCGRIGQALRDAVLDPDPQVCENGCQAAIRFSEYDLIPTLINVAEDASNPNSDRCAATLLTLTEHLYEELTAARDVRLRRDPQLVRKHVAASLEQAIRRPPHDARLEIIEAFLLLAGRDNAALMQILADPLHGTYRKIIGALTHSPRAAISRLVLSYLEDPAAPSALLGVLSHRTDRVFIEMLLRKIGQEPTPAARHNLKRIESIAWLREDMPVVYELDEATQFSAVQLIDASGMKQAQIYNWLVRLAEKGNTGGRRGAVRELARFPGADANQLVLKALHDADPQVQAAAVEQLRQRGIPQALIMLVDLLESPHNLVRQAARDSLSEFNFSRFISAFDMLDDEVRRSTGALVKRVDVRAIPLLKQELQNAAGKRRMRALRAARCMLAVPWPTRTRWPPRRR